METAAEGIKAVPSHGLNRPDVETMLVGQSNTGTTGTFHSLSLMIQGNVTILKFCILLP
jgi:hypothetical protein